MNWKEIKDNQEEKQFGTFRKCSEELRRNQSKQTFTNAIFRPTIYVLHIGTTALLTYLIGTRIIDSDFVLNVGLLVTFSQYIDKIYTPIQQIVEQFDLLQSSLAAGERISEILETEPDIVDDDDINLEDIEKSLKDEDFNDFSDFLEEESEQDLEEIIKGLDL